MSFWRANVLQSLVFAAPHLLIILVAPALWWVVVLFVPFLSLILGWLRFASGSIWPPWRVHGFGNFAVALFVAGG